MELNKLACVPFVFVCVCVRGWEGEGAVRVQSASDRAGLFPWYVCVGGVKVSLCACGQQKRKVKPTCNVIIVVNNT